MGLADEIGRRVRAARKDADLDQTELAAQSGVGQSTISAIERGARLATTGNLEAIANALHRPMTDLVPGASDAIDLRTLLKDPGRNVTYRGVTLSEAQREAIMTMIDASTALGAIDRVGVRDMDAVVEPKEKAPAPKEETDASRRNATIPPIERIAALHSTERDLAEAPTTPDERAEEARALQEAERAELERRRRQGDAGN